MEKFRVFNTAGIPWCRQVGDKWEIAVRVNGARIVLTSDKPPPPVKGNVRVCLEYDTNTE